MANLNLVVLIGRVVAPPELRYTPNGKAVASFRMAVDRRRGSSNEKSEADFIPVVAWERLGEICNEYLSKGKLISIQGSLRTRNYETQDGQKRSSFEVVANEMQMLSKDGGPGGPGPGSGERSSAPRERQPAGVSNWSPDAGFGGDEIGMDDVPF
jgi:single-strand DNA-binding protein